MPNVRLLQWMTAGTWPGPEKCGGSSEDCVSTSADWGDDVAIDGGPGGQQPLPAVEVATARQRLGAAIIDFVTMAWVLPLLFAPLVFLVLWLMHFDFSGDSGDSAGRAQAAGVLVFLVSIPFMAMLAVVLGIHGRSVGRVWLGLRVAQSDGSQVPATRLFLRYVVKMACIPNLMNAALVTIAPPLSVLPLMAPLWFFLLVRRRWTPWDYLAKTAVIQELEGADRDLVSRRILALGHRNQRRHARRAIP